jgi:hypothetical protein
MVDAHFSAVTIPDSSDFIVPTPLLVSLHLARIRLSFMLSNSLGMSG